jgi:hypothetical protein
MRKTALNYAVDAMALVLFVLLGVTGAVIRYVLPPGSGQSLSLWGLGRHDWGGIHFWISVAFLAAMALHLALHWAWILGVTRGPASARRSRLPAVALVALAVLAVAAAAPFLARVQTRAGGGGDGHEAKPARPAARPQPSGKAESDNLGIRGSTTLAEAADVVGVPVADLLRTLQLPPDTDPQERLGPFGREHGFTPEDVRALVHPGKGSPGTAPAP